MVIPGSVKKQLIIVHKPTAMSLKTFYICQVKILYFDGFVQFVLNRKKNSAECKNKDSFLFFTMLYTRTVSNTLASIIESFICILSLTIHFHQQTILNSKKL